jgi:predicted fused transcriptional regulator/phosphomethylpyrimidine kinase
LAAALPLLRLSLPQTQPKAMANIAKIINKLAPFSPAERGVFNISFDSKVYAVAAELDLQILLQAQKLSTGNWL